MVSNMFFAASFNEKLVLSNGLSISPLKKEGNEGKSLRECILAIDNEKDLSDYLTSHHPRLQPKTGLPKYEKNHVCHVYHQQDAQNRKLTSNPLASRCPSDPSNLSSEHLAPSRVQRRLSTTAEHVFFKFTVKHFQRDSSIYLCTAGP